MGGVEGGDIAFFDMRVGGHFVLGASFVRIIVVRDEVVQIGPEDFQLAPDEIHKRP